MNAPSAPKITPRWAKVLATWGGAPAVVAILCCIAFGLSIARWDPATIRSRYQVIARAALDRGDFPTAVVASRRLLDFGGPSRDEALFGLALANRGAGNLGEASSILEMIAPPDKPVFAPAHLYVARTLLSRTGRSPEEDRAIVAQLGQVLTLQPDSPEANGLLFELIEISRRLRDQAAVAHWRQKGLSYYGGRVEGAATPSEQDRIFFAEALLQTGNFEKAEAILRNSAKSANDETSKRRLAIIREAWVADLAARDPANLPLRAKVIGEGLDQFPTDRSLLAALLDLGDGFAGPIAAADTPATLLAKGIQAWRNGDRNLAKKCFSSACQGGPASTGLVGQLALEATFGKKPDPGLAIALIESASARAPDDAAIRSIRERILSLPDHGATGIPKR